MEPIENAFHIINLIINDILHTTHSNSYISYISGSNNFRKQVDPQYKANRSDDAKPIHLDTLKEYIMKRHKGVYTDGCEADDMLGIDQHTNFLKNDGQVDRCDTVICTIDKDLDMIAGHHYNFVTKEQYWVDEESAAYCFWKQMLTGDRVDNIFALKGVGPKTAEAYLSEYEQDEWEDAVYVKYQEYFEEEAFTRFRTNYLLLWIARNEEDLHTWQDNEWKELEVGNDTPRVDIGPLSEVG